MKTYLRDFSFNIDEMQYVFMIILLFSVLITEGQSTLKSNELAAKLKTGDIVFQDLNCGDLCDAIETVTQGVNNRNFSHCGIVMEQNGEVQIIEAIGDGVVSTPLDGFLKRSGDSIEIRNVLVGRLTNFNLNKIASAIEFACSLLGKPYDNIFTLGDDSYYCSELVYESFKHANNDQPLFLLNKMTFKDPTTNRYFPAWVEYYKSLDVMIPEGEWGINPGSISRDLNLTILEFYP